MNTNIYIPSNDTHQALINDSNLSWMKISDHYRQSSGIDNWRELQPRCHCRKGSLVCTWQKGHSAFELAAAWEYANPNLPPKIKALFSDSAKLLVATPEHTTPLKGKGQTSKTDVLAFVRAYGAEWVVAVEGKVDERFGDGSAEKWLKSKNYPDNRITRLCHILCQLDLSYQEAKDIPYQLLHRTACAVIEAKRFGVPCAAMVVHSFSQKPKPTGFGDFEKLLRALGVTKPVTAEKLYEITGPNISSGVSLFLGWSNSEFVRPPTASIDNTSKIAIMHHFPAQHLA